MSTREERFARVFVCLFFFIFGILNEKLTANETFNRIIDSGGEIEIDSNLSLNFIRSG